MDAREHDDRWPDRSRWRGRHEDLSRSARTRAEDAFAVRSGAAFSGLMPRWHLPLDPDCPAVTRVIEAQMNDPIWASAGVEEEWWEDFEKRHRSGCDRCREYGVINIEVM